MSADPAAQPSQPSWEEFAISAREKIVSYVTILTRDRATEPPTSGFWGLLEAADRAAWRAASTPCMLAPDTLLCQEGAPATEVFVLAEGWCKVYSTDPGDAREVVLALRGPGDILGESSAVPGGRRNANVLALTPVRALSMTAERLRALLRHRPTALTAIRKVTEDRIIEIAWRMSSLTTGTGPQRLADLLLNLADRYPPAGSASRFPPAQREHDLANWAATSPAWVTRTLATWRSHGLIGVQAQHVTLTDVRALRAIAERGRPAGQPLAAWPGSKCLSSGPQHVFIDPSQRPASWSARRKR